MRSQLFTLATGALGFAAIAASAPALSSYGEDDVCSAVSIVFVTVSATEAGLPTSTVTVTSPASTLYLGLGAATEVPSTTVTLHSTLSKTVVQSTVSVTDPGSTVINTLLPIDTSLSTADGFAVTSIPLYDATITETSSAVVTNVNVAPPSGGTVSYTGTPAPEGLLSFMVENGTTYWLNGKTPDPSQPLVIKTSSVKVVPVYGPSAVDSTLHSTLHSTLTVHSTVKSTAQVTVTETAQQSSSDLASGIISSPSISASGAPASNYTGMGLGGWNSSSTSGPINYSTGTGSATVSGLVTGTSGFSIDPSSPLYKTYPVNSLSTHSAQSGLDPFTTSTPLLTFSEQSAPVQTTSDQSAVSDPSLNVPSTSTALGQFNSSQPIQTGFSPSGNVSSNSTCTDAPYGNSTSSSALGLVTSAVNSAIGDPTTYPNTSTVGTTASSDSSASGLWTSSDSYTSGYPLHYNTDPGYISSTTSASGALTSYASSTGSGYWNSTSSAALASGSSGSSASGAVTSSSSYDPSYNTSSVTTASSGNTDSGLVTSTLTLTFPTVYNSSSVVVPSTTSSVSGQVTSSANATSTGAVYYNSTSSVTVPLTSSTDSGLFTSSSSLSSLGFPTQSVNSTSAISLTSSSSDPSTTSGASESSSSSALGAVTSSSSSGYVHSYSYPPQVTDPTVSFSFGPSTVVSSDSSALGAFTSSKSSSLSSYTTSAVNSSTSVSSYASSSSSALGAFTSSSSLYIDPATNSTSSSTVSYTSSASGAVTSSSSSSFSTVYGFTTSFNSTSSALGLVTSSSSSVSSSVDPSTTTAASTSAGSTTLTPPSYAPYTPLPHYSYGPSADQTSVAATVASSSKISSSASSTVSATPSTCGEQGDFVLNFDDIPPLSVKNESINDVSPEPVFNPYHQFLFSDGFTVVPPPTDPYLPSSKPLLVEFVPNFNINGTNTQAGPNTAEYGNSGVISDGDDGLSGCFMFNFYGASFGCDSKGPACDFTFTGYNYDSVTQVTSEVTHQAVAIPACPALAQCSLTPIILDNTFKGLSQININVTAAGQPKIWWMDDVRMGWTENSCTTGLCRLNTHIH